MSDVGTILLLDRSDQLKGKEVFNPVHFTAKEGNNMPRKKNIVSNDRTPLLSFEPRTDRQAEAIDVFLANDLTFLLGPAGTGKTHLAVYLALKEMQEWNTKTRKRVEKIVVTRPIIEAGEHLGALPGEIDEKVHPYMLPIYDCVSKLVGDSQQFITDNFEIAPLAYMRGRTFEHCVTILDEAQNCTTSQLTLFMSRLGIHGKMIISGDEGQSDIGRASGLKPWAEALRGCPGVGFVDFTDEDIVRHPLVRAILARRPK
jgi:phosphate starvation-inducible PhoH-like protein